jgi:hypothetical protein
MFGRTSAAMTLDVVYSGLFEAEFDDVASRMNEAAGHLLGRRPAGRAARAHRDGSGRSSR